MITFWFSCMFTRESSSCNLATSDSKSLESSTGGEGDLVGVPITPGPITFDFWLDLGFHSLLCCEAAFKFNYVIKFEKQAGMKASINQTIFNQQSKGPFETKIFFMNSLALHAHKKEKEQCFHS